MKAILKFDLTDDDDNAKWTTIRTAEQYAMAMHEFAFWLRKKTKYECETEAEARAFHEASDEFWRICGEHRIDPVGGEE